MSPVELNNKVLAVLWLVGWFVGLVEFGEGTNTGSDWQIFEICLLLVSRITNF